MSEAVPTSGGPQPVTVFAAALADAAAKERGSRTRRPDRIEALAGLTASDLGHLSETFAALLHGPADVGALTDELHAVLQAMSPEAPSEEARDA